MTDQVMDQVVRGRCDERFAALRDLLATNVATGEELGVSLAVVIDGAPVVDLVGGHRDIARSAPWTEDTITNVWSTTKMVTNLAALMCVDRGVVDVDAPVAQYWPEFATNGKEGVLVRHVLSHTSGVSGLEQPAATEDLYDWEGATSRMAQQAPWWEPGTASGYHALNQGHLIGEILRRVTGTTLKQFVADEIAGPLGADFQIGAAEGDWPRIADVVPPPPLPLDFATLPPDSPMLKTFIGPAPFAEAANTAEWRRADMGACNGHGNARSVARILSAIANGGSVDGVRLLSAETTERIFEEQVDGVDLVLGAPLRWGLGYALPKPELLAYIPQGRRCFWGGWGGSMAVVDPEHRMVIAYVMNKMAPGIIGSDRSAAYIGAVYEAVGAN